MQDNLSYFVISEAQETEGKNSNEGDNIVLPEINKQKKHASGGLYSWLRRSLTQNKNSETLYYNEPSGVPKLHEHVSFDCLDSSPYYNLVRVDVDRRHSMGAFGRETQTVPRYVEERRSPEVDLRTIISRPSPERKFPRRSTGRARLSDLRHIPTSEAELPNHRLFDWNANIQDFAKGEALAKECSHCGKVPGLIPGEMVDLVIIYSNNCTTTGLWVSYLNASFSEMWGTRSEQPLKVHHQAIETFNTDMHMGTRETVRQAKLQLLIVSPTFLNFLNKYPKCGIGPLLRQNDVLAVLLGVAEQQITDHHRSVLLSYDKWYRYNAVDQDVDFVTKILSEGMHILSSKPPTEDDLEKKGLFSVFPKKVKLGSNLVFVVLNEPLTLEDKVSITLRNKETIVLNTNEVMQKNPYNVFFTVPDRCFKLSSMISIQVIKNEVSLGWKQVKCESKRHELDTLIRSLNNPLEFICSTLGFPNHNTDPLDEHLTKTFQKNIPADFSLLNNMEATPMQQSMAYVGVNQEYPTLLHFAARFGLQKFAWELLECPGGDLACTIKNSCNYTPVDLAESSGFQQLADNIKGFKEMADLSSMYQYIKLVCEEKTVEQKCVVKPEEKPLKPVEENPVVNPIQEYLSPVLDDFMDYDSPRCMDDIYLVPPKPRLVHEKMPVGVPQYMKEAAENLYLPMSSTKDYHYPEFPAITEEKSISPSSWSDCDNGLNSSCEQTDSNSSTLQNNKNNSQSSSNLVVHVQDQLLEMINDYKNNLFTISEVEQLFDNWKTRIEYVNSTMEKQKMLADMREEYQRIQEDMQSSMKKPTPFERISNFFHRGKARTKSKTSVTSIESMKYSNTEEQTTGKDRPISSLSTHSSVLSSSSSERMSTLSTWSHGSLADSGTHSDSGEEKKVMLPSSIQETCFKPTRGIGSYEIPPSPVPVLKFGNKPLLPESTVTIRRPCMPIPRMPRLETMGDGMYISPESVPVECLENMPWVTKSEGDQHDSQCSSSPDYLELKYEGTIPSRPPPVPPPETKPQLSLEATCTNNDVEKVPALPPRKHVP